MKKLQTSASKFSCFSEKVRKAYDPVKPSLERSLKRNRDNLDTIFQEVFIDYKVLKSESEEDINAVNQEGQLVQTYNDTWFNNLKNEYYELVDLSDEKLEFSALNSTVENNSSKRC